MKKQLIWVFELRKSVHYWWSYILFSPECKELTSMLDPLLYRWGVPPVVIRCVHWTMQMGVLQTWIKALGLDIVMRRRCFRSCQPRSHSMDVTLDLDQKSPLTKRAARRCRPSNNLESFTKCESHTGAPYSRRERTSAIYADSFSFEGHLCRFLRRKPRMELLLL